MLSEAFTAGQLSLILEPAPGLALLPDPYDPRSRSGIPRCRLDGPGSDCYLMDASYFKGRYYLYWGPVPAVLLAGLRVIGVRRIGDNALALVGASMLFLFMALCVWNLWRTFFDHLPRWLLVPPVLLAGVAYPLPWVLDAPLIYEAAILLGSAALMAGLAFAIPSLVSEDHRSARLVLVGILWGVAFGTRAVLGLPVAVLVSVIAYRLLRDGRPGIRRGSGLPQVAVLTLPLLASVTLTAMYNTARFSNPLEFGLRYAVGSPLGHFIGPGIFDWGHIAANTYNYLFAPFVVVRQFPFLGSVAPEFSILHIRIPHPELSSGEYVTGLLAAIPFLFFGAYLLWWLECGAAGSGQKARELESAPTLPDVTALRRVVVPLALASVAAFAPLLSYYVVTARYLLDVSPLLIVLAGVGSWTAYATARTPITRGAVSTAIAVTSFVSAMAGILLGLNNPLR